MALSQLSRNLGHEPQDAVSIHHLSGRHQFRRLHVRGSAPRFEVDLRAVFYCRPLARHLSGWDKIEAAFIDTGNGAELRFDFGRSFPWRAMRKFSASPRLAFMIIV